MDVIFKGISEAFRLLITGDSEVLEIVARTLQVSVTATLISVGIGMPLGVWLALNRFFGRGFTVSLVNFGMGLPPVVIGLATWVCLTRYGPLGTLGLLYTPIAMIIAQAILAIPIVAGFSMAAIQAVHPKMPLQIRALGANRLQFFRLLLREAQPGLWASVIAGFGGVVSEVGASLMVGGNLKGQTRVLTTAIALEVSKGKFELAAALSIILILLAFLVAASLSFLQQRRRTL